MKNIIAVILILNSYIAIHAQNHVIDSLQKAYNRSSLDSIRVFTLLRISLAYYNLHPDSAILYAQQAHSLAEKTKFTKGEAQSLAIIGNLQFETGNSIEALETHLRVLQIYESRNNMLEVAACYNNIARIYEGQEDYQNALNYYVKAKDIFEVKNKNDYLLITLLNIGYDYEKNNQLDFALLYQNRAYQLGLQVKDNEVMGTILANLGNIYYKRKDNKAALTYYKLSVSYALRINDQQTLADAKYGISQISKERGEIDSAISYAKESLTSSIESSYPRGAMEASAILSKLYENKNEVDSAYEYYKNAITIRDTLFNAQRVRKIQEMSSAEQLRKKEIEDAKAKYRSQIKLVAALAFLGVFLVTAIILYYNSREKQKADRVTIREARLAAFRSQMNPHFIFNSLNSIQHYIHSNEKEMAESFLSIFSSLIRQILDNSARSEMPLSDELNTIELYLKLEKARFGERLNYEILPDANLDLDNMLVPSMIIQPYIENAIIHGLASKDGGGKVTIYLKKSKKNIICIVEDDGIGIQKSIELQSRRVLKNKSKGMGITKARLEILNQELKIPVSVNVMSLLNELNEPCGTQVKIYIPVNERF